jgi:hypothetical protein
MTIEAMKTQIEPQINRLLENIAKLQASNGITENVIPSKMEWEYGSNERIDDWDKIELIREIQRTMSIPYSTRAEIITPLLSKLVDGKVEADKLIEEHRNEIGEIKIDYGEI